MRTILNSRYFIWLILAFPGFGMLSRYADGRLDAMGMLHPTGEFALRFMIIAMLIGPLIDVFGSRRWLRWLLARRRWIGFAAFLYALAHLVFYVLDMGLLAEMLAEITEHGIWTGWAALLLMALPGLASTDWAMRALGRSWKRVQQFAYPAALLSVLHWGLLTWEWVPALVHIAPLVLFNALRLIKRLSSGRMSGAQTKDLTA